MFLKSLTLSNILSFGPEPHTVELGPLNVIIGPNGSGKSNFIEAIGLLKAAPRDIGQPIREGGGISEWLWKGEQETSVATLDADLSYLEESDFQYHCAFSGRDETFFIWKETIRSGQAVGTGLPVVVDTHRSTIDVEGKTLRFGDLRYDPTQSVLSQLQNPFASLPVYLLGEKLKRLSLYPDIQVDRNAPARSLQKVDMPNEFLAENAGNLGLMLSRIKRNADARQSLRACIQELYENIDDIDVQIVSGAVQVFVYEGRMAVPATRLSSGTLRFLCLLAILLHPEPPPLICIEEPELGLHPDLIPTVSRLLKEASERTQIIVTTHSDILVDTMTDRPEAVLVAEKGEGGTRLTRLDPERLKPWLEKYRLGDLWTSGQLGGTRW